jgi:transketolase N-terminal domain/subunit
VADVLAVVHQNVCENGDELVFSKGHAAAALYASLANLNLISEESLIEFGGDKFLYMVENLIAFIQLI